MAKEKKPAFQWYPKDFLSDEHVITMTMAQRGVYISLLSLCWLHETIPDDEHAAARLCGATAAEMRNAWAKVRDRFTTDPTNQTRLRHGRLDIERERQARWVEKSRVGGSKPKPKGKGGYDLVEPNANTRVMEMKTEDADEDGNSEEKENLKGPTLEECQRAWFEVEFWPDYWRKVAKESAWKAFKRHASSEEQKILIITAEAHHSPGYLARDIELRPHAATWLNQRRYEEPFDEGPASTGNNRNGTRRLTLEELQAL